MRALVAIPVYNEERHVAEVLAQVREVASDILVVNDGSTDGTSELLAREKDIHLIVHCRNRGYGAAIRSAMGFALAQRYDVLVTMDCDGQHEPYRIPVLLEALTADTDMVSGSRYLRRFRQDSEPPQDRRRINQLMTQEINERLGLCITDAFCGFKAYRVAALRDLDLTEDGWAMPVQLWVQAAFLGWRIREVAVPRLYLDPHRAFGGLLDDPEVRLAHYREVLERELARCLAVWRGGSRG
ncbi:Undecaprenyl-phosphate mannosyltransferase [bacterium HR36]|nr:Undecaprenyl-phosphate mannosyltransferase [bacterium HR36]